MNNEMILKRLEYLLNLSKETLLTNDSSDVVDDNLYSEFISASLSFLISLFGKNHPFYIEFNSLAKKPYGTIIEQGTGILNAAKKEIEFGWLSTYKELVSSEIFSNFLEQAEYLLSQGYKDPAAVIIGGVLEGHLRQLCLANQIEIVNLKDDKEIPKKTDTLNSDLKKAGIYNDSYHKMILYWLSIRNKAAHGEYDQYTKEQVELFYSGLLDFISKHKA